MLDVLVERQTSLVLNNNLPNTIIGDALPEPHVFMKDRGPDATIAVGHSTAPI
jgi:hypothetical protein